MKYDPRREYNCNLYITKIRQYNLRIFNQFLAELGITDFTCEQSSVLQALWKNDALSCHELASRTGLAPNTITMLVNHLIKNGLVQRQPDPFDRRMVIIVLTEKGRVARQDFERVLRQVISIGFAQFSEEDYEFFEGYLERLCTSYEQFFFRTSKE